MRETRLLISSLGIIMASLGLSPGHGFELDRLDTKSAFDLEE